MAYQSTYTGQQVQNALTAALTPDTVATGGSTALITSGAVYAERLTAGTGINITNGVISVSYSLAAGVNF